MRAKNMISDAILNKYHINRQREKTLSYFTGMSGESLIDTIQELAETHGISTNLIDCSVVDDEIYLTAYLDKTEEELQAEVKRAKGSYDDSEKEEYEYYLELHKKWGNKG